MVKRHNRDRWASKVRAFVWLSLLAVVGTAIGQESPVVVPAQRGRPSPEQMKAMMEARAAQQGAQPAAQPAQGAKPEEKDKKPEGEGDKKKEAAADTVKRPEKPPRVPDPRELEVALDDKGRVPPFNFIGQPWPDVMQWLANVSKSSLDWQELPNDFLNLTTQRSYALDEVHDLINRHLHARGFTSIRAGEVLSVFKIDKLDPSLVRRVEEDELYDLKSYDYVKVSFELPSDMELDKAKDDVKQVLSPSAKVFPLATTRRLLIMDSVANLRTVSELLNQERMVQDGRIVPRNFPLKYARPQQVIETLYVVLGVDPKAKPAQTDPQQMQQQMQMMQQMQQQGKDVSKMMKPAQGPAVYLAFNRQLNSVMANAPPKEMKIIEQTIALLDVPFGGDALGDPGSTTTDNGRTMEKYPLTTLDPENFLLTLEEIGGLSPYAEFKVDIKSKTLFALATKVDHAKIAGLIADFDGTGRQFEVIWLRRLPADAVAATINKLMGGQNEEEDSDSDRRSYYYSWYDRGRDDKKDKPLKGFGVDADIENNRLLMWANEAEMQRVRDLLIKLGEIPSGQRDERQVRLLQTGEKPTAELLQQLRDAWVASGGNELIINVPPEKKPAPPIEENKKKEDAKTDPAVKPAADRSAGAPGTIRVAAHYAQLGATAAEADGEGAAAETADIDEPVVPLDDSAESTIPPDAATEAAAPPATASPTAPRDVAAEPPPVTITVTEDGQIMLSSPDTAALDRLEELIGKLSPPEKRFKVYRLKHIPASHMYWDLIDYFKEDLEEEGDGNNFMDWYWGYRSGGSGNKEKGGTGLAKRRKLMITYDVPNNAILVSNASPSQTAEIEQLIAEFDRPAPTDSVDIRETANIKIHFSKPSVIAAAVKEVYRDLLSSRDKEFDRGEQKGEQRTSAERVTVINYGGSGGSDENRPSSVKLAFDGALSLGADDVSGVLIVSAQKGIFDDIVKMVRELDTEAAPRTTVHVHRVNGNVTPAALQKALDEAVGKSWLGNRPEQTGSTGNRDQRRDGDRDRDRDRGDRRSGDNN